MYCMYVFCTRDQYVFIYFMCSRMVEPVKFFIRLDAWGQNHHFHLDIYALHVHLDKMQQDLVQIISSMYLLLFRSINDFRFSLHVVVFVHSAKHVAFAPLTLLGKYQSLFFFAIQAPSLHSVVS